MLWGCVFLVFHQYVFWFDVIVALCRFSFSASPNCLDCASRFLTYPHLGCLLLLVCSRVKSYSTVFPHCIVFFCNLRCSIVCVISVFSTFGRFHLRLLLPFSPCVYIFVFVPGVLESKFLVVVLVGPLVLECCCSDRCNLLRAVESLRATVRGFVDAVSTRFEFCALIRIKVIFERTGLLYVSRLTRSLSTVSNLRKSPS